MGDYNTVWCDNCKKEVGYHMETGFRLASDSWDCKLASLRTNILICNNCNSQIPVANKSHMCSLPKMCPGGIFFKRPTNE